MLFTLILMITHYNITMLLSNICHTCKFLLMRFIIIYSLKKLRKLCKWSFNVIYESIRFHQIQWLQKHLCYAMLKHSFGMCHGHSIWYKLLILLSSYNYTSIFMFLWPSSSFKVNKYDPLEIKKYSKINDIF